VVAGVAGAVNTVSEAGTPIGTLGRTGGSARGTTARVGCGIRYSVATPAQQIATTIRCLMVCDCTGSVYRRYPGQPADEMRARDNVNGTLPSVSRTRPAPRLIGTTVRTCGVPSSATNATVTWTWLR